jgi:hypothetical protein
MNQNNEKINRYFGLNSVRSELKSSLPDKKRQAPIKVSDKELAEESYRWDSTVHKFFKIER